MPLEEIVWSEVLTTLQGQMTKSMFSSVMQGTNLLGIEDNKYIIQAATPMAKDWLEHRLKDTVERAISSVIGTPVIIEFRAPVVAYKFNLHSKRYLYAYCIVYQPQRRFC